MLRLGQAPLTVELGAFSSVCSLLLIRAITYCFHILLVFQKAPSFPPCLPILVLRLCFLESVFYFKSSQIPFGRSEGISIKDTRKHIRLFLL